MTRFPWNRRTRPAVLLALIGLGRSGVALRRLGQWWRADCAQRQQAWLRLREAQGRQAVLEELRMRGHAQRTAHVMASQRCLLQAQAAHDRAECQRWLAMAITQGRRLGQVVVGLPAISDSALPRDREQAARDTLASLALAYPACACTLEVGGLAAPHSPQWSSGPWYSSSPMRGTMPLPTAIPRWSWSNSSMPPPRSSWWYATTDGGRRAAHPRVRAVSGATVPTAWPAVEAHSALNGPMPVPSSPRRYRSAGKEIPMIPQPTRWRRPCGPLGRALPLPGPNPCAPEPAVPQQVLVIDDHPPIRDWLAMVLAPLGIAVLPARSGEEALALIRAGTRVDAAICDVLMPPAAMEGVAVARILWHDYGIPCLILTSVQEAGARLAALYAGVFGYVVKARASADHMRASVSALLTGAPLPDPLTTLAISAAELRQIEERQAAAARALAQLTPQQRVVAQLVQEGKTNREIAEHLVLARSTVNTHVSHILERLNLVTRRAVKTRVRFTTPSWEGSTP